MTRLLIAMARLLQRAADRCTKAAMKLQRQIGGERNDRTRDC